MQQDEPDHMPGEPQPGMGFAYAIMISAAFWCIVAAVVFGWRYL